MRRNVAVLEEENDKLRGTMREMVDDYTKQLELRDDTIKRQESMIQSQPPQSSAHQYAIQQLRQELDDYKSENRMLQDKLNQMPRDDRFKTQQLQDEIERLNMIVMDKEREIERQAANQKTEWAGIYAQQKATIDKQQNEIVNLQHENQNMRQQNANAPNFGGKQTPEMQETAKRLKKRELECQALWDTLKDMKNSEQNIFDASQMLAILAKRSLDSKSSRKIGIP